jgi:hypothetical protein
MGRGRQAGLLACRTAGRESDNQRLQRDSGGVLWDLIRGEGEWVDVGDFL